MSKAAPTEIRCPRCEAELPTASRHACNQCGFDFRRHFFTSWETLRFKFSPEYRTPARWAKLLLGVLLPPLLAFGIAAGFLHLYGFYAGLAAGLVLAAPAILLCVILPLQAFLKQDPDTRDTTR